MAISGFPDWGPNQQRILHQWRQKLEMLFDSFGFLPLDTPIVERLETLLSKGGDHEIYTLGRWGHEEKNPSLGLRFDLTVPLARYVSDHANDLIFPYRRHQIAPVFRGERPQEGRYRQFLQCDIDVVGRTSLSARYEAEVLIVMDKALEALCLSHVLGPFLWRINHSALLPLWAQEGGIASENIPEAIRIIDKRGKIPFEGIVRSLEMLGASSEALEILTRWGSPSQGWLVEEFLEELKAMPWGSKGATIATSLEELQRNLLFLGNVGASGYSTVRLDPLLARGLTYYSATVYELTLQQHPNLGSVGGGGRYDYLGETVGKSAFPGVGLSLGLSRLLALYTKLSAHHTVLQKFETSNQVLITTQCPSFHVYSALANSIRAVGIGCEVFLDKKPLWYQLRYANEKKIPWVCIGDQEELNAGHVYLRSMFGPHEGKDAQQLCPLAEVPVMLRALIAK